MNAVIGEILPLALAAGLSPIPLIAAVLLLMSGRRSSGAWFAAAWFTGTLAVVAVGVAAAGALSAADSTTTRPIVAWAKIVFGLVLLALAVRKIRSARTGGGALPGWMSGLETAAPPRAAVLGLLLSAANPKNALLGLAAGLTIGTGSSEAGAVWALLAGYAIVATLGVGGLVVWTLLAPASSARTLTEVRRFLTRHNAVIMALLLIVFGVVLVSDGIRAL
jgi:threonine/homoserine/homoserine lactone efflux protein